MGQLLKVGQLADKNCLQPVKRSFLFFSFLLLPLSFFRVYLRALNWAWRQKASQGCRDPRRLSTVHSSPLAFSCSPVDPCAFVPPLFVFVFFYLFLSLTTCQLPAVCLSPTVSVSTYSPQHRPSCQWQDFCLLSGKSKLMHCDTHIRQHRYASLLNVALILGFFLAIILHNHVKCGPMYVYNYFYGAISVYINTHKQK